MHDMRQHFDTWSLLVILATLVLFGIALFEKGLVHDLLLEAGVLQVSVKLILMTYKNGVTSASFHSRLDQLLSVMERLDERAGGPAR